MLKEAIQYVLENMRPETQNLGARAYGQKHEKVCGAVRVSGRLLERRGQGKPF